MIVKCEQCQTRFKIPDDKVTDKGVKVRCTKCQHTFRVKRDGTLADAAPAPAKPEDPFDRFGPSGPPPAGTDETRPGIFAVGVEASKNPDLGIPKPRPSFAPPPGTPREVFEGPTKVGKPPPPPPGRAPLAADPSPFDFGGLDVGGASPAASAADPNPFDFGDLNPREEVTARAKVAPPPDAKRSSPSFEPAPFDFGALPASEPTAQAAPLRPSAPKPAPAPPPPSHFTPEPFDFGDLNAPEPTVQDKALRPASGSSPGVAKNPFAFAEPTVRAQGGGPAARPSAPPAPRDVSPFDFGSPPPGANAPGAAADPEPFDFGDLGGPPPASKPPPKPAAAADPLDFSSLETLPPPPPSASKPMPPPPAARPAAQATKTIESPAHHPQIDLTAPQQPPPASLAVTQVEKSKSGDLLADIPFSDDALALDSGDGLAAEPGARDSLFDMPAVNVPEPVNQLAPPPDGVPVAKIDLEKKPASRPPGTESSRNRRGRGVLSFIFSVFSAAVLLAIVAAVGSVVLNDGKIDPQQSLLKLKAMFSAPRELVAFDISNGLYDTRVGRPVFYVRGEIKNRGSKRGKVKVKAEILDGEELVRAGEALAGVTPSPEELYGVVTADDLVQLAKKLAPAAKAVEPGAEASFLVAFYEYPPDLKDFRVRVTVSPDDGKTAAR
jgi:predicted Zn finger-like uncharacterized protein